MVKGKKNTATTIIIGLVKNGQRSWTDILAKKIYKWQTHGISGGQKVQTFRYKINKLWRCNVKYGDYI